MHCAEIKGFLNDYEKSNVQDTTRGRKLIFWLEPKFTNGSFWTADFLYFNERN